MHWSARNKYNRVLKLQMYSKNEGIFITGTGTESKDTVPVLLGSKLYGSGGSGSATLLNTILFRCASVKKVPNLRQSPFKVYILLFHFRSIEAKAVTLSAEYKVIGKRYFALIFSTY
jgi:hypothetical protein